MPLNRVERLAIIERDNGECQGCKIWSHCDRREPERMPQRLEVHHVIPQGYSKKVNLDPDYPENLITLCRTMHTGHPDSIHPDTLQAKQTYKGQKDSFKRMIADRRERLDRREIYWNSKYDRQMSVIAIRNTQKAEAEGWDFPREKNSKNHSGNTSINHTRASFT